MEGRVGFSFSALLPGRRMSVLNPRYALVTVAYCVMLFWLSSTASPVHLKPMFPGEDKLVHAVLYGGLALVVSMGLRRRGRPVSTLVQFWGPVAFAFLYGISDEFHQRFVPGRTADVWDACADGAGALVMQIVLCRYVWRLRRGSETKDTPGVFGGPRG